MLAAPCSRCWQLVAANSLRPARCFQLLPAARRCHLAAARACGAQHRPGAPFVQSCLRPQPQPFVAALCGPQNQPFTGSLGTPNPQQITVYHYCDCQANFQLRGTAPSPQDISAGSEPLRAVSGPQTCPACFAQRSDAKHAAVRSPMPAPLTGRCRQSGGVASS